MPINNALQVQLNPLVGINYILDRRWLTILIIFILALSLRSARPLLTDRIAKDGVLYVYMARDIADGNLDKAFNQNRRMPPLYLFAMSTLSKTGISVETSGKIISILSGSLLIIVVYLIAEMIFSSRIAAMASFLVAFNPNLIKISAKIMRDSFYLFLMFTALYFLIKAMRNSKWNILSWAFSGLFISLAVAVRTEAIELILFAISAIIIEIIIFKKEQDCLPLAPFVGAKDKSEDGTRWNLLPKWSVGIVLLFSIFYLSSIPLTSTLKGTTSTWTIIDNRIMSYFRTISKSTNADRIELEETL